VPGPDRPLTGLPNRRAIEAATAQELARRARHPAPLALGLIDIDHFKEINRRHLLSGGDRALVAVARTMSTSLRAQDRVGRVGGEEFLVVAPQTNEGGAAALAERIRAAVAEATVNFNGRQIAVTVSVGFAVTKAGVDTDYEALHLGAAGALAEAKDAGRNCYRVHPVAGPPPQATSALANDALPL
jgi:diguanylate cyclase (GGDEF)-like protein